MKTLITVVIVVSSLFAGERKSSTLAKARAALAMADTVLNRQAAPVELSTYTVALKDPVTGETFKVSKAPPTVTVVEEKTATAMLLK